MAGRPAASLAAAESAFTRPRRKTVLRRQFARHWSMIWFLRGQGMSGRRLRDIYGAEALIWAVGGGIDTEIA